MIRVLVILALAGLTVVTGQQLSCDSILRRLPAFSHLFAHCDCLRNEWTDWLAVSRTAVPASQCPSRSFLTYERRQRVINGECEDIIERETICEPDVTDRIILALGLGIREQQFTLVELSSYLPTSKGSPPELGVHVEIDGVSNRPTTETTPLRRNSRQSEQVCHHVTVPHDRRGRSIRDEYKSPRLNKREYDFESEPLSIDPTPFDIVEHGSRYRRSHRDNCEYQHILFVLDISGSVREETFNNVTSLLGNLTMTFCKKIKVAVMTFNHEYFLEFCFDEYGNNTYNIGQAISSIPYHRPQGPGTRWTHTAGAAQCACDYMLTPTCGLPLDAGCTDVIFLTDGHANDPRPHNICTNISCLHNRAGVDTFAIGVGSYNTLRMECYAENDLKLDEYHLFNFVSFAELQEQFELVLNKLLNTAQYRGNYNCASIGATKGSI